VSEKHKRAVQTLVVGFEIGNLLFTNASLPAAADVVFLVEFDGTPSAAAFRFAA
jgi:hypothetical protein